MLIQIKEIKTKSYPLNQGFWIDIVTSCKEYNAWLYHKSYGIKEHIYGMQKQDITYDDFLDLIENTIDEDIKFFVADYFNYADKEKFYAKNNILES